MESHAVIPIAEQYTREELVTALQELADELGHAPTTAELKELDGYPLLSQFIDVFGSWNAAKEAADLKTFQKEGRGEPYSDAELLELLRELAQESDDPVTVQKLNEAEEYPSVVTYQRRFGSWNTAKAKAGLDTQEQGGPKQYTDADLLEMLQSLVAEQEQPLRVRDVEDAEDVPDISTFERRFGSWNAAKEQAGLETRWRGEGDRSPTYTDAELLEKLRTFAEERDGPVTKDAVNAAADLPAASTYAERFGSWKTAKEAAGIEE